MTTIELPQWTGAYAVTRLVGRETKLEEVLEVIASAGDSPQIIVITGEGGIGKTRFLRAVLDQLGAQEQHYRGANDLVDVYDLDTHSIIGLTERIVATLHPSAGEFADYQCLRDELARSEAIGIRDEERDLRQEIIRAFVAELTAFSAGHHVVIALDTVERMAYAAEMSEAYSTVAEGWRWLAEQIPHIPHVTWLVAGREPSTGELISLVPTGIDRKDVTLDQLDEQSSISYFDAAAEVARANSDLETAGQLATLPLEFRKEAYEYAHGRPLLLALLADLLLVQGLPATQKLLDDTRPAYRPDTATEQAIITRLIETPGMGAFLLAAGRLRKGFDVTLMCEALKVFRPNVTLEEVEQQLDQFRKLSFVKEREDRLFLHDVMYEMLDAQVYRKPPDLPEAKVFYDVMIAYNTREMQRLNKDTEDIYRPIEVKLHPEALDRDALVDCNRRRHMLLTERLYYLLRRHAEKGFHLYFRATFDAVLSSDVTLDLALESELLAFLNERDPSRRAEFVDELERSVCEAVARVRPVARQVAAGQYKEAIQLAEALRREPGALAIGGTGTEAIVSIWEAYARIYRAALQDMEQAKALLDHSIETLSAVIHENDTRHALRLWRARGGLAFGYMVRGYLHWTRGALEEATDDYTQSVYLGREVRVNVNLATAENDLGFVRAEAGDIDNARRLVHLALRRRREQGTRAPVAFSLNTLALIDIREGQYNTAIDHSSLAFATFSALGHKRGETLALIALAEAKRRYASSSPNLAYHQRISLLKEASEHAKAALALADELGEKLRQIEALIEAGCAPRDMLRILFDQPVSSDAAGVALLIEQSSAALQQATDLAEDQFMYRKLDALVNLGYLWYYAQDLEQAQTAIQRAEQSFPREYLLVPDTGAPTIDRERANAQIWTQIGKLHTLRGHIAFEYYRTSDEQIALQEATENYLLSLKYNSLYSPDHPGMRLMHQQVEDRLQTVRGDLRRIVEYVLKAEQKYRIQDSQLRRLVRRMQWIE